MSNNRIESPEVTNSLDSEYAGQGSSAAAGVDVEKLLHKAQEDKITADASRK
jgi:hypothetical protein